MLFLTVIARQNRHVHPCPCCGYRTLPSLGDYELCPVCWWEDDGGEPWDFSGPNGQTLIEGQREFLALRRPYLLRSGKVRAPRKREARDPAWCPYEMTAEVRVRIAEAYAEQRRLGEESARQVAEELARNPEGPFAAFNVRLRRLRADAPSLSHAEVETRYRELLRNHAMVLPEANVELASRLLKDEHYYRRHPLHAAWWFIRYARPGRLRQRWQELRTGSFRFAG